MNRISSRTLAFGAVFTLLLTLVTVFAPNQASAAGGTISLRSHVCPATYDGPEASIYGLAANCQAVGAQIPVSIVQGITQIDQSSTNLDGTLNYVGFSGGEIVIDQTAPAGTSVRAFCAIYSDTSGDRSYREYANPIDELLQTGESFDCEIYNVPYASVVQGSVYVNKHNCPVGFDVYGADMYGLATGCHEAVADGTAFTLSDTANPAIPGRPPAGSFLGRGFQRRRLQSQNRPRSTITRRAFFAISKTQTVTNRVSANTS